MRRDVLFSALVGTVACRPAFDDDPSRVDAERILAVRIEPPETAPGTTVTAEALVASPMGTSSDSAIEWGTCREPKSPAENRSVAPGCLGGAADPVGEGTRVTFIVPPDACTLFGPETPPGNFRPRDPDATGGYYQPVRVRRKDEDAVALERVVCRPSAVSIDVALDLARRYTPNRNPKILPPTGTTAGAPTSFDHVVGGSIVRFEIGWASGDAERYVSFDPDAQAIVTRREAMRVSWFATNGEYEVDTTGRDENDQATTTDNAWHAPDSPGMSHFWAVLRDSRGALDFTAWDVMVVGR